jgi:hypothetical protein
MTIGKNDDHSVTAAALVEYPDLWRANPYGVGGGGLVPLLESSPRQYASLFRDLPAAGDRLYQGSGGNGDRLQDGHQAFAPAMNAMLQGSSCYTTINIKAWR